MKASELTNPERIARAAQMIAFAMIKNYELPSSYIAVACALPEKKIDDIKAVMTLDSYGE